LKGVQWETISLEGFGPFTTKKGLKLEPGLNLLIAPNETGKSTIAEGLRAVIFGLPNSKDPVGFTTARFRSWQSTDNFAGEVSFMVAGKRYRISRDFASHRVVIEKKVFDLWEVQLETEHNPAALKTVGDYQSYLEKLFGLTSGKLFADTFYLTQPLPENDRLAEELRILLSGSGSDYENSLKLLEDEMAGFTKFLKERGFPRNKNNNRRLEELEEQILNLENGLKEARGQVDELQHVLVQANQVTEDLKSNQAQYQNKTAFYKAWQEGRRLQSRYEELLEKQVKLTKTKEELLFLEARINNVNQEIAGSYQDFLGLSKEFPEELEQMLKWEEEILRLTENALKLGKELEDQKDSLLRLSDRLAGFYHFQQNPHFVVDFKVFKRTEEKFLQELEQARLLLEELTDLRAKEEGKERSKKVFLKRTGAALAAAAVLSLLGGQTAGVSGLVVGFIIGSVLGWGLSHLIFGGKKAALLLPQTKSFLASLARRDSELNKAVKELTVAELQALLLSLDYLLNQKKSSSDPQGSYQEMAEAERLETLNATPLMKVRRELIDLAKLISPYRVDVSVETVEKDYLQYDQLRRESNFGESVAIKLEREIFQTEQKKKNLYTEINLVKERYPFLADPSSSEAGIIKERWQVFQGLKNEQAGLISEFQGILKGAQVKDLEELDFSFHEVQNQVIGIQKDLSDLGVKHPGLPAFIGNKTTGWEQLEEMYGKLEEELADLSLEEERLLEKQQELKLAQVTLEGKGAINIAQGEIELQELCNIKEGLLFELDALEIAYRELKSTITDYNLSYRERLGEQITFYFNKFTDSSRTIIVTENFETKVIAAGQERDVRQFSQGTKDLLFFALRLAVGDILAEDFQLPFVLDDPFLNYDHNRLQEVKRLLQS